MPRSLLPAVYREASAILDENPANMIGEIDGFYFRYACGAIEKALKNRMKKKFSYCDFAVAREKYISFLFLVYAPEKLHAMSAVPIWSYPTKSDVNPRKFGLLFLANLLDSGMKPKDFLLPEHETEETIPF